MKAEVIELLRKSKTMSISTCDNGPWTIKVFYAMDRGFIFLLEKGGKTLEAIKSGSKVSFAIDFNRPDLFVQGYGKVEVVGEPGNLDEERGILLAKVPEDTLFSGSGHTVIVRLVPEMLRVTDMRGEPKKYIESFNPDEMTEKKPLTLFRALRPWTFQMSVSSLILGVMLADRVNIMFFILSIAALIMAHGAFNELGDYFDYISAIDRPEGLGSGGSRVLIDKFMAPRTLFSYSIVLLTLSLLIGFYLIIARPAIALFVLIGVLAGVLYGLPKFGLKWISLGDVGVFLAFGPGIVLGSVELQGGQVTASSILISIAIGMIIVAVLHANNWRDIDSDASVGARTVASVLGENGSLIYYLALIWLSYPIFAAAVALDIRLWPILGSLLTVPWAIKLTRTALNPKDWNRKLLDMRTGSFTALHMYLSLIFLGSAIAIQHFLILAAIM
ncbi:MAG: UbiA family prenyltransferase [Conexivisphaerales archaeon]